MTPLTVFFRTLLKSSAIFIGAGYIMLHPSLDMRSGTRGAVTAQKSPMEQLIGGLTDEDPAVRRQAAASLARGQNSAVAGGQKNASEAAITALIGALKD